MKVLCACEESQAVTIELRKLGVEAYSCDLYASSGGHPEWHLQQDVLPLLGKKWDMIIAFPPCTHLSVAGARYWTEKHADGRQQQAFDFFMKFAHAPCKYIAIENPVGYVNSHWRKPDQIFQPYQFGDEFQKRTCLWLKNLPTLVPTNIVGKGEMYELKSGKKKGTLVPKWYNAWTGSQKDRSKMRSKTFPGVAKAMAIQWSTYIKENN